MYLLDTNVVSELRKAKAGKADANVTAWADGIPATSLFLSVVTVQELETGTLLAERRDPSQGRILRTWLEHYVMPAFAERILHVDVRVARRSGHLHVPDPKPFRDGLIAATAFVHAMTVVTRNVKDFQPMGVKTLDPWAAPQA